MNKNLSDITILLVDDDEPHRIMLGAMLNKWKWSDPVSVFTE